MDGFPKYLTGREEPFDSTLKKSSFGPADGWSTRLWSLVSDSEAQADFTWLNKTMVEFAYEHRHSLAIIDDLKSFVEPKKVDKLFQTLCLLSRPLLACHILLAVMKAVPGLQKIRIYPIQSPAPLRLSIGKKVALRQAWHSLGLPTPDVQRHTWIDNHEKIFQEDCVTPLMLVHAEVQLVDFYRRQSGETLAELHNYIGCNKKACFMCQLFFNFCDLKLENRGCQGTISNVPWTVPCNMAPHLDR